MGTLLFHILLFSAFLLSDIQMKGRAKEELVIIEFPDIVPEEEEIREEPEEHDELSTPKGDQITNQGSNRLSNERNQKNTLQAEASEYQAEVDQAKQLVSDVNRQLSKKVLNIDDIKIPVQTTEGMDPDSIKNVVYTGESNVTYYLENRYHVSLPIPVYLSQEGGKVVVDIVVDREGRVIQANSRKNSKIRNDQIYLYAKEAAMRTIFNESEAAPVEQKGSIHYTFIAQ